MNNNLTTSDLQNFADSFITSEIIEAAQLIRVTDFEGAEKVGGVRNASKDYSGIIFPYFFPEQSTPREYRLRLDNPELELKADGTMKEKGKYLSPPGRSNMIYFPPNCRNDYLADISLNIIFTEGEKKALALDRASRHGLDDTADKPRFLALGLNGVWNFNGKIGTTTTPNGGRQEIKGLIPDFHLIEWQTRSVLILYDPNVSTNESVKWARLKLAANLKELGANVFFADCPEVEGCNGIDDVLGKIEREQNTDEAVKQLSEILASAQSVKKEKKSQANQIIELAEGIELFHTSDDEAFATFEIDGHFEHHRLNSKIFRQYLAYQFYRTQGMYPSIQAVQDALQCLNGRAMFEGETRLVNIRLASFDEKIYLDLCNDAWQMVEIDKTGWRIIESKYAPVRFRRSKAMLALPTPTGDGDISKLKNFLNVDEKNLILISAWLINCFRPDFPFPILMFSGEQGTAKSTASRVLRELIDPSTIPLRSSPRNERDLVIAANNAWVCAFDNLSAVPDWLSDALCRLSTGGGFGTRTLYENDEETIFTAKRPIILNGIGDIASRSDLLDRAILVKLEVIPKDKRRTERELWAAFEAEKTLIFSALLEAVSVALRELSSVAFAELPRMADFALWATAAEQALGFQKDDFINNYTQNREDAHSIVLEGSILAEVLQEFCVAKATDDIYSRKNVLLKDFLAELQAKAGEKRSADKKFPKSSKGLRNAIERINPNLREVGIFITFNGKSGGNAKHGASLSLEYSCKPPSPPSPPSSSPLNMGEKGDVTQTTTITGTDSNITNSDKGDVTNVRGEVTNGNHQTIITTAKANKNNGLSAQDDVSDGGDVHLQSYSNGKDEAGDVDIEI